MVALVVAAAGVLLGLVLSGWAATPATRPVEQLADAAARSPPEMVGRRSNHDERRSRVTGSAFELDDAGTG